VYYAPPGYLLYAKDGALVARTFDARTLAAGSAAATVVEQVGANAGAMSGQFDVSDNGVLAYFRHSTVVKTVLRWFDRSGRALETLNAPEAYSNFRVAPDDRRVVVDLASDRVVGRDVWVLNPGAAPTRITFGGSDDWWPFWSPDGQRVAFMSYRNGVADFYVKTVNGSASEEPLVISDAQKAAGDWSRDGRFVTYWVDTAESRGDIWVSPVHHGQPPIAVARTAANERRPRFSPDGRYVAYDSDESGRGEVYVQPFPPTGGKWQVSIGGGTEASWNRSGRELYYVDLNGGLNAVAVTIAHDSLSVGRAERLFDVGRRGGAGGSSRYEPASDGRRFLVRQVLDAAPQPIRVMLNWPAALRR
jgi:Tol biopolymer transport system component